MQIHELNNYTGDLDANAFLAVDDGSDTGKVSASKLLFDVNTEIENLDNDLNARIDNIIAGGAAPSEAEIIDARLGAAVMGNPSYPSLGDAIRGQITDLDSDLTKFLNYGIVGVAQLSTNNIEQGAITSAGVDTASAIRIKTRRIPVRMGTTVSFTGGTKIQNIYWLIYANDGTVIHANGWEGTKTYHIEADCDLRLMFKASDDSTVTPSDFDATVLIMYENKNKVPVIELEQFSSDQNLLTFSKRIDGFYVYGTAGEPIVSLKNNSYYTWRIPVEQTVYYMTATSWWALTDEHGNVLAGCGVNGSSISSIDVSQYPSARYFFYSRTNTNSYFSKTSGGTDNKFTLNGLVSSAAIPNNNIFDIPDFKYITGKAWNLYFAGGWLRNAEYKRTSNGYMQYEDHFSYRSANPGTASSTLKLLDNDFDQIGSHVMNIQYVAPNYRNVTALFIGDSTINNGAQTAKVLEAFTNHGVTCMLLGTTGSGANKREGRSGWTAADYCGATTRGQDTSQNPFYNPITQTFDFSYYMTQQGYSDPGFVFIQLGINDMFSAQVSDFNTKYNAFKGYMLDIVDSIHNYNQNIKIVVNLIPMPNGNISAFNTLYGCSYYNWERRQIDIMTNSKLIDDLPAYALINPHNLILDPMTHISDDVHPTAAGYAILGEFDADIMFAN